MNKEAITNNEDISGIPQASNEAILPKIFPKIGKLAISNFVKTDSVITPMIHSKSCAGMSGITPNNILNTNISNSQSQTFVQKQKNEYEIQWDIIPVITQDMLNILSDTFRVVSICTPLLEDKLVKHIASIPKYAKINYVDKILKTYTSVTMEKVI